MTELQHTGAAASLQWPPPGGEDERLLQLERLLANPTDGLEAALEQIAAHDESARVRYAARKALALWRRRQTVTARLAPVPESAQLEALLASPEAEVRMAAAQQAAKLGRSDLMPRLRERLTTETDAGVRARLVTAFERLGEPADVTQVLPLLADPDHRVRANAVLAAAALDLRRSVVPLLGLLADPDHRVRANCSLSLAGLDQEQVLLCLERMLEHESVAMRDSAAFALARMEDPVALPLLRRALTDRNPMVRQKAQLGLEALAAQGVDGVAELLATLSHDEAVPERPEEVPAAVRDLPAGPERLTDPNPKVRLRVLTELIADGRKDLLDAIAGRTEDEKNEFVLSKVLVALGELGDRTYVPMLRRFLQRPEPRLAATAVEALTKLRAFEMAPAVRQLLTARAGRVRAAAILFLSAADRSFDPHDELEKMFSAREYELRLAGLFALERLNSSELTLLVEPLLSDLSEEVRHKAYELIQRRTAMGDEMARDLLELCRLGLVERKQSSLRLVRAPAVKRLLAFFADFMAIYVAGAFALGLVVLPVVYLGQQLAGRSMTFLWGGVALVLTVLFFVRDSLRDGRGIGKKSAGLRVVDLHRFGGVSPAKALIRQSMLMVPVLNLVELGFVFWGRDGRRVADRLLDTQVIDEEQRPLTWLELASVTLGVLLFAALLVTGVSEAIKLRSAGQQTGRLAGQLKELSGVDAESEAFAVERLLPAGAVLSRCGDDPTMRYSITLQWKKLATPMPDPMPDDDLKAFGRGVTQGVQKELEKVGVVIRSARMDYVDLAGGRACKLHLELKAGGRLFPTRIIVWVRKERVATARLEGNAADEIDVCDHYACLFIGQLDWQKLDSAPPLMGGVPGGPPGPKEDEP